MKSKRNSQGLLDDANDTVKLEHRWRDRIRREYEAPHIWEQKWGDVYRKYLEFGTKYGAASNQNQEQKKLKLPPIDGHLPEKKMFPVKKDYAKQEDKLIYYYAGKRNHPQDMYYLPSSSAQEYGWQYKPDLESVAKSLHNEVFGGEEFINKSYTISEKRILSEEEMKEYEEYLAEQRQKRVYTLERFPAHIRGLRNPERFMSTEL